jgi:nucleoside-diphosphate-sugar epimerase
VNVDGTANIVNMALEAGISKLIHISSVAALGRLANGGEVNEDKKWEESKVNTDYAKSKHKAELEVYRGIGEGLDAVILNPSTILGFGDWNSSSCAIFRNIYKGFKYYTSGLNGFVAVEDVARAAVLFLEKEITAERFLLNGDNWHFQKLQYAIADGLGKKRPSKKAGPFLLGIAWRLQAVSSYFSGQRPLLTRESAKVALSETRFYSEKINRFLPGFSYTPIETSIERACERYLQQLK